MENSGRKLILKAGIPLAVSLAGFIYSLITTRRKLHTSRASEQGQESRNEEFGDGDSFQNVNSTSLPSREEEEGFIENAQTMDSLVSLRIQYRPYLEENIFRLMNMVRALQDRERDLETRFLCYCSLKEYELGFTKLDNILVLEKAHVEFLRSKVESMEAENRRFELMVVEYLRVLRKLEATRLENGLLQRKSKKLLRWVRKYSNIARLQASTLLAREAEISTNQEELRRKAQVIDNFKDEIIALKRLQDEKKEFCASSSVSMKRSEETGVDNHEQLVTKLEKLEKDRAAEAEELIYLRWINACLRHQLTRNQEQQEHEEEMGEPTELKQGKHEQIVRYDSDATSTITDHGESCAFIMTTSHKKPKLLHKFRRWVKGSETCTRSWNGKEDKENYHRIRCVSDRAAEEHVKLRKSCSSA